MMPSQHGVDSRIDDRKSADWPKGWHALDGLRTLPKLLGGSEYHTALIGKYHLGEPSSPTEGFDHWVTLEDDHIHSFYNNRILDNGRTYQQPGHSVDFFTNKARDYMTERAQQDQPLFPFLPYPAPYVHWPATQGAVRYQQTARYDDCPMDRIPRQGISKPAVDGLLLTQAQSSKDLDLSMLMCAPDDLATLRIRSR